ncbi:MFS transporter [Actinomadura graeca]|uniref:MFS transporter n=1 Tax=Actinomadura graeca TaxID=2750812 RepID=A0ABX8QZ18_9ACTN|nr:MFS transporter [Actinomadura graeca]QXJ23434.1 MFS transporter [Actinomadura graeca]
MTNRVLSTAPSADPAREAVRACVQVTLICWVMVVIEGYDLISFGTVVPVLLDGGHGFTKGNIGWVAAAAFGGALVGALGSGWASDRYGRRPLAIASLTCFTLFTFLCGFATGPVSLGALRFLAGIGIGGIVPAASALTLEFAVPARRTLIYTIMLSGVPFGGVLAALVGIPVLEHLSWHWMFFVALGPGVALLPLVLAKLPESAEFLDAAGRHDEAERTRRRFRLPAPARPGAEDRPAAQDRHVHAEDRPGHAEDRPGHAEDRSGVAGTGVFAPRYVTASIVFALATFCGLFTWFGLATWLPGIMRKSGYPLGSSLVFLLVLNLGAVIGSLFVASATDRWGNRGVAIATYLTMTAALMVMVVKLPQPPLLAAIAIAGVGGHGGQILINAYVSRSYPAHMRARALGWSLGAGRSGTIVGPVVIGWIVGGRDPLMGFPTFAAVALLAALLLAAVPRTPAFDTTS